MKAKDFQVVANGENVGVHGLILLKAPEGAVSF
jgi:hypothetical protein